MAIVQTDDVHYHGMADAIRAMIEKDTKYTPAEMVAFFTEGGKNVKPWNIPEGITIMGVPGTLKLGVTPGDTTWPFPDADDTDPTAPPSEDAMDEAAQEDDPDVNTEDKMVLVDNNGNITVGYLYTEPDSGLMVYGGAVLPELPETEYQYAYLGVPNYLGIRNLHFTTEPLVCTNDGSDGAGKAYASQSGGSITTLHFTLGDTAWEGGTVKTYDAMYGDFEWVNTDVLKSDGTVLQKASEPTKYDGFQITWYDPTTTNFKAVGWRRVSKHTTGELAGQITKDDFTRKESGGWNYLRNIRSCTREKLYYKGVEVWPNDQYGHVLFDGSVTVETTYGNSGYYYGSIPGEHNYPLAVGDLVKITVNGNVKTLPIVWNGAHLSAGSGSVIYDENSFPYGFMWSGWASVTPSTPKMYALEPGTYNVRIERVVTA